MIFARIRCRLTIAFHNDCKLVEQIMMYLELLVLVRFLLDALTLLCPLKTLAMHRKA
jgi:hypothetical protein